MKKITKAVFPVAGLGTRFLPATKATPKEMLPIVDKPLIQYAVEEAVAAGIKELIFITSGTKRAIEDHFDRNWELENHLEKTHKKELLDIVQSVLPNDVHCAYVRQTEQLGLGHAVLCAAPLIGDEPFAVLLADDLIDENGSQCLSNMISLFESNHSSVIAVQTIAPQDTHKYGVIEPSNNNIKQALKNIVEKPATKDAPSNFGVVGRYVLTPKIFDYLKSNDIINLHFDCLKFAVDIRALVGVEDISLKSSLINSDQLISESKYTEGLNILYKLYVLYPDSLIILDKLIDINRRIGVSNDVLLNYRQSLS